MAGGHDEPASGAKHSNACCKLVTVLQDEIGWGGVHVVGISMGAMVACEFAGMFAQLVQSLMLLACPCGGLGLFRGSVRAWEHCARERMDTPFAWGRTPQQRAEDNARS